MPELPEVETVRRGLAAAMVGRRVTHVIVRRADLRRPLPPRFAERIAGRTVTAVERRAKYLLIRLNGEDVILGHLGMSGRMVIDRNGRDDVAGTFHDRIAHSPDRPSAHKTHEHLVFMLNDGTAIRYSDPRRFGLFDFAAADAPLRHPLLAALGPEPTDISFGGAVLAARLAGKRTPIKAALLDQRVVAGLGNIYVCESLYRAGISPRRLARTIAGDRAGNLASAIRDVIAEAIEAGGSSLRDHRTPEGEIGYFQHQFRVYDRAGERCPGCDCARTIRRIVQSGRSTFYCAARQR